MGKNQHAPRGFQPSLPTILPTREVEEKVLASEPEVPEPIAPVEPSKVPDANAGKKKVWVVLEERKAALTGAYVTLPKGKIIKKEEYAKRLIEQNIPLEEKYI